MISAYHHAISEEDIYHEGRRAQKHSPRSIDVYSLLCFIISGAFDERRPNGERGCRNEVHHDDQSTPNETTPAFIADH